MGYLPEGLPLPNTQEIDTREWWAHCKERRLVVQRCTRCGTCRHPPVPACYNCHSFDWQWHQVGGRGMIHSYIICHHPAHPALRGHPPYNVILVELADAGGARMVGNLLDVPNEQIRIGMEVEVTWEEKGDVVLPQWRRAST